MEPEQPRPTERVCVFRRRERSFALPLAEVVPAVDFEPIPLAPPLLAGLFNLRGELLPLLRLEPLFDLPDRPAARGEQFLVIRLGDSRMALWVDKVVDIAPIDSEALQNLDPARPYTRGTLEIGATTAWRLDLDQIVLALEDQMTRLLEQRLSVSV
jgi:purine-binding chemotaxis protein CheW